MKNYFREGLEKIKVSYDEDKIEKSLKYLEILLDYNSHTNLTAIREEKAIIEKHFLDSLLLQHYLRLILFLQDLKNLFSFLQNQAK